MVPIRIKQLVKRFGRTTAVDQIDLDIPAGSLFFLLGPSGCGKTTLLRMIAGFIDPTAGTIHFGPREVTHVAPNHRNCGMVFQSYALWPHMTVAQNVAFGLQVRKVSKAEQTARVDAALAMVQMTQFASRKPNQLSGGQQQRVALARAIVIKPDVLLLDEPLSNLDAKLRLDMRSQIRSICKQANITAVYVTHDQKEALSMADEMAVLKDGKLIQKGQPRHLYERPANRFVADFLGETNFVSAEVLGHDNGRAVLRCPAGQFYATLTGETPKAGNVTCSIRPEAIRVVSSTQTLSSDQNSFAAKPMDVTYLGEMAQHIVSVHDNLTLKAFELNPQPMDNVAALKVAFSPSDVVVLRD